MKKVSLFLLIFNLLATTQTSFSWHHPSHHHSKPKPCKKWDDCASHNNVPTGKFGTMQVNNLARPITKTNPKYTTCKEKSKKIEGKFKSLGVSPATVKAAVTHDVTSGVAQAHAHATAVAKKAPGKAKAVIADAQAIPGKAVQGAKAIIAALPKTPHQAIADVKRAEKEAVVTGADILNEITAVKHAATQCHCTFLEWQNTKDINTLNGIRSHLYSWPQKGYKDKAKFCEHKTSGGYTVSYNATEDQIQAAFKKAVSKALNKAQATLNSTSQTLADAEEKLMVSQASLKNKEGELNYAATPVTTEIATLTGDQAKITAGLKKVAPVKTLLLSLVPSDKALISKIGKTELSAQDIAKLKTDVASVCTLLVMFQSITQSKSTSIQAAIEKALQASNTMLEAQAKIAPALVKLNAALKKVKATVASGKIALKNAQATITTALNTVKTGYKSLESSLQTVSKTLRIMKDVMGIDIVLHSQIVPLDQDVRRAAAQNHLHFQQKEEIEREKSMREEREAQERRMMEERRGYPQRDRQMERMQRERESRYMRYHR